MGNCLSGGAQPARESGSAASPEKPANPEPAVPAAPVEKKESAVEQKKEETSEQPAQEASAPAATTEAAPAGETAEAATAEAAPVENAEEAKPGPEAATTEAAPAEPAKLAVEISEDRRKQTYVCVKWICPWVWWPVSFSWNCSLCLVREMWEVWLLVACTQSMRPQTRMQPRLSNRYKDCHSFDHRKDEKRGVPCGCQSEKGHGPWCRYF
ncbi:hypothetical protein TGPRC2_310420 [Toxoplasma gondii TgCatPRC2]|uniref:Uncharacterized protein n=1 Tax=Toxoplasma gondii TgCatPRC2 TaxID=1130821 RepID=A0A151HKY4_TOXGO|nr:hypothetical protein TGPRC2_310420 [Toxoplasma gondii TgCatPRC2]